MKIWSYLLTFVVGLGMGLSAPLWTHELSPYLPEFLTPQTLVLEGKVVHKQREPERLLITVATPEGTILATFQEKVMEMDLLIGQGDRVTLEVPTYEPFVSNPQILRVVKGAQGHGQPISPDEESAVSPTPEQHMNASPFPEPLSPRSPN